MYEGFMASGYAHDHGGGANTLCLTEHSHAPPGSTNENGQTSDQYYSNRLYGMEYENTGAIDKNHDMDAACAVYEYEEENSKIYTEWGRYGSCSTEGHVKVYEGLVMGNKYHNYKGENVCVDIERGYHAENDA